MSSCSDVQRDKPRSWRAAAKRSNPSPLLSSSLLVSVDLSIQFQAQHAHDRARLITTRPTLRCITVRYSKLSLPAVTVKREHFVKLEDRSPGACALRLVWTLGKQPPNIFCPVSVGVSAAMPCEAGGSIVHRCPSVGVCALCPCPCPCG